MTIHGFFARCDASFLGMHHLSETSRDAGAFRGSIGNVTDTWGNATSLNNAPLMTD